MKGDYFRYLAEVATGTKRKEIMNESQEAYKAAFDVAQKEMPVSEVYCICQNLTDFQGFLSGPISFFVEITQWGNIINIGENWHVSVRIGM